MFQRAYSLSDKQKLALLQKKSMKMLKGLD